MKNKSHHLLSLLFFTSLMLGACNMPANHPIPPPTALINPEIPAILLQNPVDGSIYDLGSNIPFILLLPGINSSSLHDVAFLVNGSYVGTAHGTMEYDWIAPHTGEYYIQGRAILNDGATAISAPKRVCVISLASNSSIWPGAGGYYGLCDVPTRIPDAASSGDISVDALASPSVISFSTNQACSVAVPITFVAKVGDPQDLVAFVAVAFETDLNGNGGYIYYLNWVTTRPVNQKEYRTSVTLSPEILSSIPGGVLYWRVTTYGRDGQQLLTSQVYSIPLQQLECSQQPLENSTIMPSPSVDNCPPGTYFAPGSQRCVQIQIVTPKPRSGNNGGNQCPAGKNWICTGITHQTCSCQ